MDDLLRFIQGFTDISAPNWNVLRSIIEEVEIKKGGYLVETGKICSSLFFISKGYCRAFNVQDGDEINTSFSFEGEIATSKNNYVHNVPSMTSIQACEPLVAYRLERNKIFEISRRAPEIELIAKRNLELIAAKQEKQLELFRILTAKGRYEYLEKYEPEMLQRVSLTHLSTYLGVKRETLSRIRNKRTRK